MTKYEQILNRLPIKLSPSIKIEVSPFTVHVYAIKGNNVAGIWLRTTDGWYKLEESDHNYDIVANAILNRLNKPVQS